MIQITTMKSIVFFYMMLTAPMLFSQLPYTANNYAYSVEKNITYGSALDFAGKDVDLLMDIYKPVGDNNCIRPCIVLVHGGSWIAGSKEDLNIVLIAKSLAEKGWVVSTINYRLGSHKRSDYNMYAFCNDDISSPCGYIADSAEVFRANYRGQQDAKGAIRFMKNRWMSDSTDVDNVFIAGESAGAFISYAATFMNSAAEKPSFCAEISPAPTPDSDLIFCLPAGYSLERPDLGDVNGTINLGGFDASVQGVGSFYGGMMNFDMLEDETDWPVMYMFHQGSDIVVHYNYNRLLGRIDWECYAPMDLCKQYSKYPKAFGSKGIENYLSGLGAGPTRTVEIIENYEYMGDCFDNGHSIDNWLTRSNSMANLFAERIALNGNAPNPGPCNASVPTNSIENLEVRVFPNPSAGIIHIENNLNMDMNISVYSMDGKSVFTTEFATSTISLNLPKGIYLIRVLTHHGQVFKKVVID